jgi:hypothetical protein
VNSRAEVTVFRFQHLAVHVHEVNDFTVVVRNDSGISTPGTGIVSAMRVLSA